MRSHVRAGRAARVAVAAVVAMTTVAVLAVGGPAMGAGAAGGVGRVAAQAEPLGITVSPATGLVGGDVVEVTITGAQEGAGILACPASVAGGTTMNDLTDSCDLNGGVQASDGANAFTVWPTLDTFGGQVDCTAVDCVLATWGGTIFDAVIATAPISFAPDQLKVLSDSDGEYFPGDTATLQVSGSRPAGTVAAVCGVAIRQTDGVHDVATGRCAEPVPVPAGDDPIEVALPATGEVTAADGSTLLCGGTQTCVIAVDPPGPALAWAPADYATGPQLRAVPGDGLTDGQVVTLQAANDMPTSFAGPPFWIFPSTGGWTVAQCDDAVFGEEGATILTVLTSCAHPSGGPLPVDDPRVPVDVPVAASITPFLGGTVDCTTAAQTCSLALVRVNDGRAEVYATPRLGFGED